jgi:hypothetical protein
MLSKISALGVLGVLAVGVAALPVKADTAVVQQTTQDMIIDGHGNATVQSSEQYNSIRTRGRSEDATGVVQDVYQGGLVIGDDNVSIQENSQTSIIEQRNNRARGGRRSHRITVEQ